MKKVTLIHPFSAKAIGLTEKDLFFSHSKPHEMALREIQTKKIKCNIAYFTGCIWPFSKKIETIKKQFWPISTPVFSNKHKWRSQYSLWHYVKNVVKPVDLTIINMSGHGSKYVFKLARLLKKKEKPYIAMIGGLHMSTKGEALTYYQNAHHIIVHTHLQKRELTNTDGFENIDIRVMPLGVDTEKFIPIKNITTTQEINLLYVGRISRLKQIELAVQTVAELIKSGKKDVKLNIIGPTSDVTYYQELLVLIQQLHLTDSVVFIGALKQNDIIPYYQKADLLLLPSAHESFGMVMVEAMACGTPVAALKGAGGPDEIIINKVSGILSHKDEYYEDVVCYFRDQNRMQYTIQMARKEVRDKFSIITTTGVLKKSINDALSND